MPRGITQGGYPGGLPKGVTQEDCLRMCGVSQGSYPGELLRRITWECGELPRFLLSFGLFYVAEGGCLGGLIMRDAWGGYQLPSGVSPGGYPERVTQSGLLSCVSSYGQHSRVCHTLCNPRVCHTLHAIFECVRHSIRTQQHDGLGFRKLFNLMLGHHIRLGIFYPSCQHGHRLMVYG